MKVFQHPVLIFLLIAIVGFFLWVIWGNSALMITEYTATSTEIPSAFHGFRIAHISDLHNAEFGKDNKKLLNLLVQAQPDMIAITGDFVDSRRTDTSVAIDFVREAVKIAPVYYVPGNHEARITDYAALKAALLSEGITVLENSSIPLEQGTDFITITGFMDPQFGIPLPDLGADNYQVALSHRPELLDTYSAQGLDLVLTGHAHGGQIRLPFIGGLIAPNQGFFPAYDSGMHFRENTTMVISRGLGNSLFPLRFNNRPELILITLEGA